MLSLLPCAAVCLAVLALRWSGLQAAALAMAVTLGLWALAVFAPPTATQLAHAGADAALLTLIVAAMVLPGILFVEATRRRRSPEAIAGLVAAMALPPAQAAILVAVGIGILVESLTGMGVSLLVTMPLLLAQAERGRAIGLGLVGMSLMPWGALAVSGLVGAKLAGLPIETLAWETWRHSGFVAFILPLLALAFVPERTMRDAGVATLAGLVLVATIGLASWGIGIEVAGVAGGLAVTLLMGLLARRSTGWRQAALAPALRPYVVLMLAMVIQKLGMVLLVAIGVAPVLSTGRIDWSMLSTPGVALVTATLLTVARHVDRSTLNEVARRGWRPLASVALFMLSARLLIEIGGIATLAGRLAGLGREGAIVAVTLLGGISGFITGSGITGNALFMPSAAAIGQSLGALPQLAALQNGAAGHVAMAALPVAAILLAALPGRTNADDRMAMRLGLMLGACHLTVLMAVAMVR